MGTLAVVPEREAPKANMLAPAMAESVCRQHCPQLQPGQDRCRRTRNLLSGRTTSGHARGRDLGCRPTPGDVGWERRQRTKGAARRLLRAAEECGRPVCTRASAAPIGVRGASGAGHPVAPALAVSVRRAEGSSRDLDRARPGSGEIPRRRAVTPSRRGNHPRLSGPCRARIPPSCLAVLNLPVAGRGHRRCVSSLFDAPQPRSTEAHTQ
jgi:hypothetical protein